MAGVGSYGMTDNRGFGAVVSFSSLKGDSFRNVAFENYGIVAASIYSSASHVKQPLTATPRRSPPIGDTAERRMDSQPHSPVFPASGGRDVARSKELREGGHLHRRGRPNVRTDHAKMAQSTDRQYPNGQFMGTPDLRKLGDQYGVCSPGLHNISDELKTSHKEPERLF